MITRAILVFIAAVVIVRFGTKRFMGRSSAFDLIAAIMLGSVLSRAITGQSPFYATLAAGATLVALHSLIAYLAWRFHGFGPLVKGNSRLLLEDGKVDADAMRRNRVGQRDMLEALRLRGSCDSVEDVEYAHLERNGDISVILKKRPPRVVELKVEAGVQRIIVQIE